MNKRYKRIYIEIINYCNLNCHFCVKNNREKKALTKEQFFHIINKVKDYTDYIYLHVQGEPLLNTNLKDFLDIAYNNNLFVQLTTNATLLDKNFDLLHHLAIRQINLSLQALDTIEQNQKYLNTIINFLKSDNIPYVSLRIWGNYQEDEIVNKISYLEKELKTKFNPENQKLINKVFISLDDKFDWPELNQKVNLKNSSCLAPSTQLGILVDGTVVPCCLDKDGIINLGNIFESDLHTIINSPRYLMMIDEFKNNKCSEELCKRCTFRSK